jgi:hypothetical protein
MRSATREEIEYVGSIDDEGQRNPALVDEMWHQLEALRYYDQNISAGDWRPHRGQHAGWGVSSHESHSAR